MPLVLSTISDGPIAIGASEVFRNLDILDMSGFRELSLTAFMAVAATGGSAAKLDVYFSSRDESGIWDDRIHLTQITGAAAKGDAWNGTVRSDQQLTSGEQISIPSGANNTGGRLAAGSVKNGSFPDRYRSPGVGTLTGWRLDFVPSGDAGTWSVHATINGSVGSPEDN